MRTQRWQRIRVWVEVGMCLGLAGVAQAQEPAAVAATATAMAEARAAAADAHAAARVADDDTLAFMAGELSQERLVKGAPYCADAVHETIQWLPDASGSAPNRIVRKQGSRLCRDGEGRTRQEVERNGRTLVYLRDPLSREAWVLDPQRKTARRLARVEPHGFEHSADHSAWRDYAERMRVWAGDFARSIRQPPQPPAAPALPGVPPVPSVPALTSVPPTPPAPPAAPHAPGPAPVVIQRTESVRTGADLRREVHVHVLRLGDGSAQGQTPPAMTWPAPPPAVSWRAQSLAPRGPAVVQPLPARDIEGLRAHGERSTWTIEAGRIGNERPIQIVREVWSSPELMLTLVSRDFDPRSGEVNYRLEHVRRGEPDAALMRVPGDFNTGRPPVRAGSAPGRG